MYYYLDWKRESMSHTLPDVVIVDSDELNETNDWGETFESGFYYAYGSPGYLPDSEFFGPYESEYDALCKARDDAGYWPNHDSDYCPECYAESLIVVSATRLWTQKPRWTWETLKPMSFRTILDCPNCGIVRLA